MHRDPKSWWAVRARLCVVHYHTRPAASTTPPSMGRRMLPCWLPPNLVRKTQGTKAPALLGEHHWKGRRSMCAWVYLSSGEDNGADRCWRRTYKRTGPENVDGLESGGGVRAGRKGDTPKKPMAAWAVHEYLCPAFSVGLLIDRANSGTQRSKQGYVELVHSYRQKCCQQNCLLFVFICS